MKNDSLKRVLALVLSFALLLGYIPVAVFATDEGMIQVSEEPVEETSVPAEYPTEETAEAETEEPTAIVTEPPELETETLMEPTVSETEAPTEPPVPEETITITEEIKSSEVTVNDEAALAAATIVASGTYDSVINWCITGDGVLTVSGQNGIYPTPGGYTYPWDPYSDVVTSLIFEEGIDFIQIGVFHLPNVNHLSLPASVLDMVYIGSGFFSALKTIEVASGSSTYCVQDNVLFSKDMSTLFIYPCAKGEKSYRIPDGVKNIRNQAFQESGHLEKLTIPDSVTYIDKIAFISCMRLNSLVFEGDAPLGGNGFLNWFSGTIYYPADNPTWTAEFMNGNSDGTISWIPYTPGVDNPGGGDDPDGDETDGDNLPEDIPEYHNTLAELTEVDYLAFAQIAYEDFLWGETVQECLERQDGNKWDDIWGEEQITYAELCEGIAQWRACYIRENPNNGFYAAAFQNNSGEAVLAYRGSKPLTNMAEMFTDEQSYKDWVENDLQMILFNAETDNNQYDDTIDAYKGTKQVEGVHTVVTTGHSLGGLWGEIASAYFGCKGITFNAISALDIMYVKHPIALGRRFQGIDAWNFTDRINIYDILAGAMELVSSESGMSIKLKPLVAYGSNYPSNSYINSHSLKSLVSRSGEKLVLNKTIRSWTGTEGVSGHLSFTQRSLDMGTSGSDNFNQGLQFEDRRSSFGGDGLDKIYTSIHNDTIVGGRGNDKLDGSWGDDTYYYFKGDGCDTIIDISGHDKLYLEGFEDGALIEMYEDKDSDYINIRYDGNIIVQIYKKNRDYSVATLSSFKVYVNGGRENDITEYFSKYLSGSRLLVQCPVNVEILDADGAIVYTLYDGEVGSYYTDYGNFYIFEENNGYGKLLDLAEGYTVRIVGEDVGTMKIESRDVVNGELAEPRNFVNIPVGEEFSAVLEETMDGDLLLAADTDGDGSVDTKFGYEGIPIPVETIKPAEEYIVLQVGQQTQLHAVVFPMELTQFLSWSVEKDSEGIISIADDGTVTALEVGTGYALFTVKNGSLSKTERCRVDVVDADLVEDEQTVKPVEIEGVQLSTTVLTTELFKNEYTAFEILLQLPQNYPTATTYGRRGGGMVMDDAYFTDETMAKLFTLVVLDDRRVLLIPTEEAVGNPDAVKSKYSGTITVTVQGKPYETEKLTLTVKKTLPKVTATIPTFNSFYSGQSKEIVFVGGTVTAVYENESKNTTKTTAIPTWLYLDRENGELKLAEDAPHKSVSGTAYLLVETEEWCIPAAIKLSVKSTYKAPALKLSASSITVTKLSEESKGTSLKLLCSNKTDSLESLHVVGITAPAGYAVENFNVADGSFTLKTNEGFKAGKITLNVVFDNTDRVMPLTITVKSAKVALKLAKTSLKLNHKASDFAEITLTATPADFVLEEPNIRITGTAIVNGKKKTVDKTDSGELKIRYEAGKLYVSTTDKTPDTQTYNAYICAGDSKEVLLTIKVISAIPSVTYKSSGSMDLTFPEKSATITPAFKNYSGSINGYDYAVQELKGSTVVNSDVTRAFSMEQSGKAFYIRCVDATAVTPSNSYKVTLKLFLTDGTEVSNTISLGIKRTAVTLKLSSAKLTLNKMIGETGSVTVICSTKGYAFESPIIQVMNSSGKVSAEDKLKVDYANGKLIVQQTDQTAYGATYKVLVKANEHAPAATLTVAIRKKENSAVTATLKADGKIDVIRDGSTVTITPTYKNCNTSSERNEKLYVYDSLGNDVTDMFIIERNSNGKHTIRRSPDAKLNHSLKYKVKLVADFGGTTVETKKISISVTMGTAKFTVAAQNAMLFAKDKNDSVIFWFDTKDDTLNGISKVEVKESGKFEILDCSDGVYALVFKEGKVHSSLLAKGKATSKTVAVTLNITLVGNETAKTNASLKMNVTVVK